jgi:hypothetical protein
MLNVFFSLAVCFCSITPARAAEQFGDILASVQPFASGDTDHGYAEFRVLLENHSPKIAHTVRLVFPDRSYGSGNCVSRISRTVSVAPNAQVLVPFWQPALPVNGTPNLRVEVDDEPPGTLSLSQRHRGRASYGGGGSTAAILVSRNVNYDEAGRVFKGEETESFTAKRAVGPADARGRHGTTPNAWTPEPSSSGPHWIELDYATPMRPDHIRIYENSFLYDGQIWLIGESGTNRTMVRITPPSGRVSPGATAREFSLPPTAEPIKTVRLDFGPMPSGNISIDAVELVGPTNSAWASAARASSDGHSSYGGSSRSGSSASSMLRAELPSAQWSENWISYTPFDGILLSASDFTAMPPAVATALWRYAECGGQLVIFGEATPPDPWSKMEKDSVENGRIYGVGLGQCFVFPKETISTVPNSAAKAIADTFAEAARYWDALPDENGAASAFAVIDNAHVPVRATVLVMLGFVVLIGPVNLIVLSRMKRRVWMLWTIPAISFATCLLVFVYSLLREGVTPTFRCQGITMLDQSNHRATSVGAMAFYCPLTPGGGLHFGYETEVTPLVQVWNYGPFGPSGTRREMDWTQAQNLERGWVSARVPAYFHLRKSETRRERIEIEHNGNELSIVNGLGADISRLWLADESGNVFIIMENVGAGKKAKLSPFHDYSKVSGRLGPKGLFKELGYTVQAHSEGRNTADFLVPGSYVAELKENPFFEKALNGKTKPASAQGNSLVFGILETKAERK